MEKEDIAELLQQFDQFVELSLQQKQSNPSGPEETPPTQVDKYKTDMEKRLKLKAVSQQDKFDRLLSTMKGLNTFISVKDFMQNLGNQHQLKKKTQTNFSPQERSLKQQYQNARGGYYIERVEEHLKRNRNKCKGKHQTFCTEPESDPFAPTQFRKWIDNTLQKIPAKQETMFSSQEYHSSTNRGENQDCLMQEHRKIYKQKFKVNTKIRQKCNEEFQSFSKISSLLTNRLRKLLKSNCATKASTLQIRQNIRPQTSAAKRFMTHRTSVGMIKAQKAVLKKSGMARVKTAGCGSREQNSWKKNITQRIKYIIDEDN